MVLTKFLPILCLYLNGFNHLWDPGDKLVGEVSRLVVAEACIQALDIECTEGKTFEVNSVEVIFRI